MRKSIRIERVFFPVLLIAGAIMFSTIVTAQNPVPQKPTPRTMPTATPPSGEAEIISRAEDLNQTTMYKTDLVPTIGVLPQDDSATLIRELNARIKKLEANRPNEYDEKQKRLLLNLDILTRAEQRSESLRKQLFEMIEKENSVRSRLDQIENDIRPEMINRAATFSGSMKPEDVREARKKSLEAERTNLQALLTEIESARANASLNLRRADEMIEKLRTRLEREIDDALLDDSKPERP